MRIVPYLPGPEQTEFKESTTELREAVISIAAILNRYGSGRLYFGIQKDGTVIGQTVKSFTLRTVSHAIARHLQPTIYPSIRTEQYDGLDVILVEFSGKRQPYLAYGIPRIREGKEDLVMEQPFCFYRH